MTGNCWKLCVCLVSTLRVFVRDLWFRHVLATYEDHTKSYKITVSSRLCVFTWIFLSSLVTGKIWLLIKQGLPTSASLHSILMTWAKLGSRLSTGNDQQYVRWKFAENRLIICVPQLLLQLLVGRMPDSKGLSAPSQTTYNICGAVLLMLKNAL